VKYQGSSGLLGDFNKEDFESSDSLGMSYPPIKARLIAEIGTRAWLRTYWDEYEAGYKAKNKCPNAWGNGKPGCHDARVFLTKTPKNADWELGGKSEDYEESRWPTKCENCGEPVPPLRRRNEDGSGIEVVRHILHKRLYSTASGNPEIGDLYWANWYHENGEKCWLWDNCTGAHLMAVLPNGREWDIDSRASNCTLPQDKLHRCWIRTGEPPMITAGKNGPTCSAGAGSILSGDYHGFLINGIFQ
jgi:hypothetical protein